MQPMDMLLYVFFNDPATPEIYTLSLHDALPIWSTMPRRQAPSHRCPASPAIAPIRPVGLVRLRSEEHTSELQSRFDLVCRLLLEKKKALLSRWPISVGGLKWQYLV